jgi:Big-like domain-containing protein
MTLKRRAGWAAAILVALATTGWDISAQISRRAVSPAALLAYPGFFQGQFVVVRGTLATRDQAVLTSPSIDRAIPLIFNAPSPGDGPVELRATFWDIGRFQRDDPRIENLGLNRLLPKNGEGDWPRPGEVCALSVTDAVGVKTDTGAPSLRVLALDPESYAGQRVTVRGQFRGRNLYGDLAQAPGLTQWDFVLHAADASLWVTGQRPRGKGFNLDVEARVDTGHWLEITGTVRQAHGLVWIEAAEIALVKPDPAVSSEPPLPPIMGPAPEVIFSDPADGEVDVGLKKVIRLQFSRDINPDSLKGNVHWHYAAPDSRGELPQAKLSVRYERANRSIEIKIEPDDPARYRNVVVELAEGIAATDGARLKPWTMSFTFGGQ